jgi:hypothetical protein
VTAALPLLIAGLTAQAILWALLAFVVGLAVSMAVLVFVLIRLPANYFQGPHTPRFWAERHPALRWAGIVGKNLAGVLLILLGIVLSLPAIPGQGLCGAWNKSSLAVPGIGGH